MYPSERVPVHTKGLALLTLGYEALGKYSMPLSYSNALTYSYSLLLKGIIYADLGTSPLYVLNGIWPADGPVPPEEDVIGGVSAIIWAIIILPLIKYVRFFSE